MGSDWQRQQAKQKGRAGVSGALGQLAGPGAAARAGEEGKRRLG